MSGRKNITVLSKMIKYGQDAQKYAVGWDYTSFVSDERSLVFSVFSLSQMGELVAALDKSILTKYDKIPWSALKSIRNRIVHDYEGVQYKIIWNIIQNEIPPVLTALRNIILELEPIR
jgi:uncharacterized protein with HEPN domain